MSDNCSTDDVLCVCILEECEGASTLQRDLISIGLQTHSYFTQNELLASPHCNRAGCFLFDVAGPQSHGWELYARLAALGRHAPVILMSANATGSEAIRAFEQGAFAFLERPIPPIRLQRVVASALEYERGVRQSVDCYNRRFAVLSPREREVAQLLGDGDSIKTIARKLGISPSTAEKHRAKVLEKTGFESAVDLARLILTGAQWRFHMANFPTTPTTDSPSVPPPRYLSHGYLHSETV